MTKIVHHVAELSEVTAIRETLTEAMTKCLIDTRTDLRDRRAIRRALDVRGFPVPFILEMSDEAVRRAHKVAAEKLGDVLRSVADAVPPGWSVQPVVMLAPDRG